MKQAIQELKAARQAYINAAKQLQPIPIMCILEQRCLVARHIVDIKHYLEYTNLEVVNIKDK